jgi:hypothetical protein
VSNTTTGEDSQDALLTESEVAARWGFHPGSLANQRSQQRGIPFVRVGRAIRYRLGDVLAYEQRVSPEPQA